MFKLVVFVPETHLNKVQKAVTQAGAGRLGNYDSCSFVSKGIGAFRPLKGAHPYLGKIGRVKKVREVRLETIVRKQDIKKVISALKQAHPYEEPAYDIYPLVSLL